MAVTGMLHVKRETGTAAPKATPAAPLARGGDGGCVNQGSLHDPHLPQRPPGRRLRARIPFERDRIAQPPRPTFHVKHSRITDAGHEEPACAPAPVTLCYP